MGKVRAVEDPKPGLCLIDEQALALGVPPVPRLSLGIGDVFP